MAFLKFNKQELVNLSYSLKREILGSNKTGAYLNTTIVCSNTRRYHGLLAVTLDRFGGDRFLLLSDLDETLVIGGKQFNLGIHRYGENYEPRGHKYIVDFDANPVPQIVYKVGDMRLRKSLMLAQDKDQVLVKYTLEESPAPVKLSLSPFLAFRNVHDLTHRNDAARTESKKVKGGVKCNLYEGFPDLYMQMSDPAATFTAGPAWNMGITYLDEYRRGYDCIEDLLVPGFFSVDLKPGESVVFSASLTLEKPDLLADKFDNFLAHKKSSGDYEGQLRRCADRLIINHNHRLKINAGFTWLYTGLLRETLQSVAGLALYGLDDKAQFEAILDNLIADNEERFYRRTTQVEAPLYLAVALQQYIDYGASPKKVWTKYGPVVKGIIESYQPGRRKEVGMQPNGLLWAQMDGVALSWMNTYIGGRAVTERAGYQVETNALWYNAICFALEMESKYPSGDDFVESWEPVAQLIKENFQPTFWIEDMGCLADYVDNFGQNRDVRPNQLYAFWVKNSPVDEELAPRVLRIVESELLTARGVRTLSPRDVKYRGVYEGSQEDRDLAYHNGCAFPALLEQYIEVAFRVKGPAFWKKAQWLSEGFADDLSKHGVGAFSELYDGDPPHEPHGAISSATSTAALLAVARLLNQYKEDKA